jgi:transposase
MLETKLLKPVRGHELGLKLSMSAIEARTRPPFWPCKGGADARRESADAEGSRSSETFGVNVRQIAIETEAMRRRIAERNQLVSQMARLKNRVHSVLHANLIPLYAGKLYSKRGRIWLNTQPLPEDQRRLIGRHLDEHDRIAVELAALEKGLAEDALRDKRVKRLMTIGDESLRSVCSQPLATALVLVAPQLVSHFGLNPKVWQSGDRPA